MRISKLIAQLEDKKEKYGDVKAVIDINSVYFPYIELNIEHALDDNGLGREPFLVVR